ncbi:MAG: enoyl-CoA hydratase/isomerase family protein [Solirubrobacteraceae bacterium]
MSTVITRDRGAVRHVILNRPDKRNAMNGELVEALGAALLRAAHDSEVRCVVIRGEGKVFSAGMDLAQLAALADHADALHEFRAACMVGWSACEEMRKPTIAQIHGACIGGALELALACDLRVVAADARLGLVETSVGLIPDLGGCSRLPAIVGVGRAKDLIMTSRLIDGTEAERIGLANRVTDAEQLDSVCEALVEQLLACSPAAVGLAKRVIDAAAKPALVATLELEGTAQEVCVRAAMATAGAAVN